MELCESLYTFKMVLRHTSSYKFDLYKKLEQSNVVFSLETRQEFGHEDSIYSMLRDIAIEKPE